MRKLIALVWAASILAMQAHSLVPHHHDEHHAVHPGHIEALHHEEIHHSDAVQISDHSELSHRHDPHEFHEHSEAANVTTDRTLRFQLEPIALFRAEVSTFFEDTTYCFVRLRHPFIPFKTGPPGSCTSRAPPVSVE